MREITFGGSISGIVFLVLGFGNPILYAWVGFCVLWQTKEVITYFKRRFNERGMQ